MKNSEIIELTEKLFRTGFSDIRNGKFQYAIAKNKDILRREVKIIESSIDAAKSEQLVKLQEEIRPVILAKFEEVEKTGKRVLSQPERIEIEDRTIREWDKSNEYITLFEEFLKLRADIHAQDSQLELFYMTTELTDQLPLNEAQMNAIFQLIK